MKNKQMDGLYELSSFHPLYLITFEGTEYRYVANGTMEYVEEQIKKLQKHNCCFGKATVIEVSKSRQELRNEKYGKVQVEE